MGRLTSPQFALLRELGESDQGVASHYGPAKKLVEAEFAEWRYTRNGWKFLRITEAGRTALSLKQEGKGNG